MITETVDIRPRTQSILSMRQLFTASVAILPDNESMMAMVEHYKIYVEANMDDMTEVCRAIFQAMLDEHCFEVCLPHTIS